MPYVRMTALACGLLVLLSLARAADPQSPGAQKESLVQQVAALREEVDRLKAVLAVSPDGTIRFAVPGDREDLTGGNQGESVGGDLAVQVGGSHDVQVGRDQRVFVDGDLAHSAERALSVLAGDTASITAGTSIIVTATDDLILRSGRASIVLRKNGDIAIKGANIDVEGSGEVRLTASGDLVMKGQRILQN